MSLVLIGSLLLAAYTAHPDPEPVHPLTLLAAGQGPEWATLPPGIRESLFFLGQLDLDQIESSSTGVAIQLFVTPPADPWGTPWQVRLERSTAADISPTELVASRTDPSGGWHSQVPPAAYRVEIRDDLGNIWHSRIYEISLVSGPFSIEMESVAVEGTVTLQAEPWQGQLIFGGQTHEQIAVASDEKGRFTVVVPRQGRWPITAEFTDGADLDLDEVDIFMPADGPARLDLILPAFKIEGTVYLEGEALAEATVMMRDPAQPRLRLSGAISDAQGRFVLRGPRAMDIVVAAVHPESKSEWLPAKLAADAPPLRVDLVKFRKLRGRILDSSLLPVAGARVELRSGSSAVLPWTDRANSAADGGFELRLSGANGIADLLVYAPGYAVFWQELATRETQLNSVEARLSRESGVLELQRVSRDVLDSVRLDGPGRSASLGRWIEVLLPFGLFSSTSSGALKLSGLGPGEYSLCLAARCKTGTLVGGETLSLSVAELTE